MVERLKDVNVCVLRVGGTNCDAETARALMDVGLNSDVLHLNEAYKKGLTKYDALILPGGFSYGDYVRAGVIWARRFESKLHSDLKIFLNEERPILGICNGFQVLVETGLLPGFDKCGTSPLAALATNEPPGYRCRWVKLRVEGSACIFTHGLRSGTTMRIPIAHAEGRFLFDKKQETKYLERLSEKEQLVLQYCSNNGALANGRYPDNPNSSLHDIAGICDPSGKIFGLMPHPERAYYGWQLPNWTKEELPLYGDGYLIFKILRSYLEC
jgi:phosphoribosylformylglycinamidine synthase